MRVLCADPLQRGRTRSPTSGRTRAGPMPSISLDPIDLIIQLHPDGPKAFFANAQAMVIRAAAAQLPVVNPYATMAPGPSLPPRTASVSMQRPQVYSPNADRPPMPLPRTSSVSAGSTAMPAIYPDRAPMPLPRTSSFGSPPPVVGQPPPVIGYPPTMGGYLIPTNPAIPPPIMGGPPIPPKKR
jgi:hypothetical protein